MRFAVHIDRAATFTRNRIVCRPTGSIYGDGYRMRAGLPIPRWSPTGIAPTARRIRLRRIRLGGLHHGGLQLVDEILVPGQDSAGLRTRVRAQPFLLR